MAELDDIPRRTRDALRAVVADHGRLIAHKPQRVKALLADCLGADSHAARAYIDAIVMAADEGVPAALSDGAAADDGIGEVHARLESCGLTPQMSDFAVRAWMLAVSVPAAFAEPTVGATTDPDQGPGDASSPSRTQAWQPSQTLDDPAAAAAAMPAADSPNDSRRTRGAQAGTGHARRPRRPVVLAAVLVAVLALGIWTLLRLSGGVGDGAHDAGHTMEGMGATDSAGQSGTPPHAMPSASAVPASVAAAVSATSAATGPVMVPPTNPQSGATAPVPNASGPPTLVAVNQSSSFLPLLTSSDQPTCAAVTGKQNLQWCEVKLDVTASGTVADWSIVNINLVEQHGTTRIAGHTIYYRPFHNGAFKEHITFRLTGGGVTSPVGVIQLDVACNTNYECTH